MLQKKKALITFVLIILKIEIVQIKFENKKKISHGRNMVKLIKPKSGRVQLLLNCLTKVWAKKLGNNTVQHN